MTQREETPCVYKATTKKGEIAHFGEYSAAKAWAGWGTVEQVPLKTLTIIQKSIQPCSTCEALSRAVMLDQTAHDNFKPDWDTQAVLVEEMHIEKNMTLACPSYLHDYTTPPQRKPLTDGEIYSLADSLEIWNEDDEEWILDPNTFARAIEAAHGIKENT